MKKKKTIGRPRSSVYLSDRQADYRAVLKEKGLVRLTVWVEKSTKQKIELLASARGINYGCVVDEVIA
jgi:hypothetical protein